jgi:predicted nucleotidyltransferase
MTATTGSEPDTDKAYPRAFSGEFLRGVVGSTTHGLSIAKTDDLDLMGICIEPPWTVLSMGEPFQQHTFRTQPQNQPSGPGDVDLTCYSLRKWLKLATNGNPSVLMLIFVPDDRLHIDSPLAEELRSLAPLIVSKEAGSRYLGYMKAQRERLLGQRGQKRDGYTRRQKYMAEAGWDTKYAMHLCRLGLQGIELLTAGKVTFPVPEPHRSKLMKVRQGEYELDAVVRWSYEIEESLKRAREDSPLLEHPERSVLNKWLYHTYLTWWDREDLDEQRFLLHMKSE